MEAPLICDISAMNDFTFNELVERRGVGLRTSRFVRHDLRGLKEWRGSRSKFDHFVSYQNAGNNTPYRGASTVFQFVPQGRTGALFVGAHEVKRQWHHPFENRRPLAYCEDSAAQYEDTEHFRYDLERLVTFEDLVGCVLIEWGSGTRAWSQWAARHEKPILELTRQAPQQAFPGFQNFHTTLDDLDFLPTDWQGALASVKGVYLLVCPTTGELYVGSAYGSDGFWGRWLSYASNGHGGNKLLVERGRSNFAISVLEVASPEMSATEIIHREAAWKEKLGSRAFGLNAN